MNYFYDLRTLRGEKITVLPGRNETFPVKNEAFPRRNETFPAGNDAFLIGNKTFPGGNEVFTVENETIPIGNRAFGFKKGRSAEVLEKRHIDAKGQQSNAGRAAPRQGAGIQPVTASLATP